MSEETAKRYRQWCSRCIDFHSHFLNPEVLERSGAHSVFTCFGRDPMPVNSENFKKMFDPERQIVDMDQRGIDKSVISSCDVIQGRTWAQPKEEEELARLANDQAADWVDRFPHRFIGSFGVPLGDTGLALRELERSVAMGLGAAVQEATAPAAARREPAGDCKRPSG
jgi:aminocarboxymuconate-semialdehyde decarboxylase